MSAVDDFLVQCKNKTDLKHLQESVNKHHTSKVDETTLQCVGICLDWGCNQRTVRLSVQGHIQQALKEFQHVMPKNRCHAPFRHETPVCGARVQHAKVDTSEPLDTAKINFTQGVICVAQELQTQLCCMPSMMKHWQHQKAQKKRGRQQCTCSIVQAPTQTPRQSTAQVGQCCILKVTQLAWWHRKPSRAELVDATVWVTQRAECSMALCWPLQK